MGFYEDDTTFGGLTVVNWQPGITIAEPGQTACRIGESYRRGFRDEAWIDQLSSLLDDPVSARIAGIVIGPWHLQGGDPDLISAPIIQALVSARDRLPQLRAIFVGDISSEENEISWIEQSDMSPLFLAYPTLEHFGVRGSNGLSLGSLRLDSLVALTIESGGLPAAVVREVASAHLPALEHLELWLGEENYGGDATGTRQVRRRNLLLCGRRRVTVRYQE